MLYLRNTNKIHWFRAHSEWKIQVIETQMVFLMLELRIIQAYSPLLNNCADSIRKLLASGKLGIHMGLCHIDTNAYAGQW